MSNTRVVIIVATSFTAGAMAMAFAQRLARLSSSASRGDANARANANANAKANETRKNVLITKLGLIPHPEGGFFIETYRTGARAMTTRGRTSSEGETTGGAGALVATTRVASDDDDGKRNAMTSIYYMLTKESGFQYWALNASDHVHYHHGGGGVTYHVTRPDGTYERKVLGQNVDAGEVMQLVVRGGTYKAAVLDPGAEFALIGEGVGPGFDFRDFTFVTDAQLAARNPAAYDETRQWIKPSPEDTFDHYYEKSTPASVSASAGEDAEAFFTPAREDS